MLAFEMSHSLALAPAPFYWWSTKSVYTPFLFFQAIAVGYAIMTTRTLDLNWHIRALRVLPMFVLPVLSFFIYSALRSFTKMRKCSSALCTGS